MLELSYRLLDAPSSKQSRESIVTAGATALRYDLFLGDLILRDEHCDLSAHWGWIPLLDIAAALQGILERLEQISEGEERFEFTESEATLAFRRVKSSVLISASYAHCKIVVQAEEFKTVVHGFASKLRSDIERRSPELLGNREYLRLFRLTT